eukprot:Colp12_sorted_trinity150504_noHs@22831
MNIQKTGAALRNDADNAVEAKSGIDIEKMEAVKETGVEDGYKSSQFDGFEPPSHCVDLELSRGLGHVFDVVVILVKTAGTRNAAALASQLVSPDGVVLTLQNGLGNNDVIAQFVDPRKVALGVVYSGSKILTPGRIECTGSVRMTAGLPDDDRARESLIRFIDCVRGSGMTAEMTNDIQKLAWHKTLINAAINPLTALMDRTNGIVADSDSCRKIVADVILEGVEIAGKCGVVLEYDVVLSDALSVAQSTRTNVSSMLADVRRRAMTEVESINGALVKHADKVNVSAPVNRTLLYLVKALGERGDV